MARKMSLLAQAKATYKPKRAVRKITKQHIELAIAWLYNEVSHAAVTRALYPNQNPRSTGSTGTYVLLARALQEATRQGRIKQVK